MSVVALEKAIGGPPAPSEKETQEYNQDLARVEAVEESDETNDLAKYETFANEIQRKWVARDKVCYARLMLEM